MSDIRRKAESLHTEAKFMRLDPEGQAFREIVAQVAARVQELVEKNPRLAVESPEWPYSRVVTPELHLSRDGALNRAAHAVFLVHAIERRDELDITSGDAA